VRLYVQLTNKHKIKTKSGASAECVACCPGLNIVLNVSVLI